ncbi:MAG TPA: GNAT family N-acetyltransferase [Dokdonella sp.]|nr:GNAT family N-acetyltransferase [Dokdonella sp.]
MAADRSPNRRPTRPRGRAFRTADGRVLRVRPVRADDIDALKRGFARLTPEQVRQRVFHRMTELSEQAAHNLVHFDPTTTAAFVVVDDDGEIRGEARMHVDPGGRSAEFAVVVDPALLGIGIGRALMRRLVSEGRRRGLSELWGSVLAENAHMLDFSRRLGAQREAVPGEADLVRVRFDLRRPLPAYD